jgi:predicted secreted protein
MAVPAGSMKAGSPSAEKTILIGSISSPFAAMSFKDQVALLGVFSLVVMIQSSVNCATVAGYSCTDINGFAVAAGAISLFFCIFFFGTELKDQAEDPTRLWFSIFMFIWWTAAMIALTFFGPYVSVDDANGYFGTWGSFFVATMMMAHTSELFRKSIHRLSTGVSRKPIMYLLIASIVEVGAAIKTCIPQTQCYNLNAFAISLGTISGIICIVLLPFMGRLRADTIRKVAIFFCCWWVVGGMIVTFSAPFKELGNGYFSVFAAVLSSFYLLQSSDEV